MKGTILALSLLLLLAYFVNVQSSDPKVKGSTSFPVRNVDTGLNYSSIQAAIDANETLDGHTIFVEKGVYYEHVVVNKSLSLVGENRSATVIDGNYSGNPVTIMASHVNVTGFTVQKCWFDWYRWMGSGIYLAKGSSYANVSHNIIANNKLYGISANSSIYSSISDNIIRDNNASGVGLLSSSNNVIFNNTLESCSIGITVLNSTECILHDNVVSSGMYGIELWSSGHNLLYDNDISNNVFNFGMLGLSRLSYENSVNTSNLVDGKPIYCLQSVKDVVLDSRLDIGTLYLIDSENVTVKDLVLAKNGAGLLLWETTNSTIENVTALDNACAMMIESSSNITVRGCNITNNQDGIFTNRSIACSISRNSIRENDDRGIDVEYSSDSTIGGNSVTGNSDGVVIAYGENNSLCGNSFSENHAWDVHLFSTYNNSIYHNNFQDYLHIFIQGPTSGNWDNGLEGNYWSDYDGADERSGPSQNITGSDGIGDTPYVIDDDSGDDYPLMGPFSDFTTTSGLHVQTICNSTISGFEFNGTSIRFNVTGESGTAGFCRIRIPTTLMNDTYWVFVNGTEVNHTLLACSSSNHSYLYFGYEHSTQEVLILPEYPVVIVVIPMLMMATMLSVILHNRKRKTCSWPSSSAGVFFSSRDRSI